MKMHINYTWRDLENDVKKLSKLKDEFDIRNIYGIPRGGLIPAVILSYRTGLPLLLNPQEITNYTLVIDDISGSGTTLKNLVKPFKNANFMPKIATLLIVKGTGYMPDCYIRVKDKKDWVQFCWKMNKSTK